MVLATLGATAINIGASKLFGDKPERVAPPPPPINKFSFPALDFLGVEGLSLSASQEAKSGRVLVADPQFSIRGSTEAGPTFITRSVTAEEADTITSTGGFRIPTLPTAADLGIKSDEEAGRRTRVSTDSRVSTASQFSTSGSTPPGGLGFGTIALFALGIIVLFVILGRNR